MINETIKHYKILGKLGEGGMGVVYKAEDTMLKRTVALKFLPRNMTWNEKAKKRFMQEARAASSFDHPNICTIYEIGETDDGQMFIVMAYCAGQTLAQRIESNGAGLPIKEAIDITLQIARGLSRTHEAGIVHRDIKPTNVVITERGEVKIVDFGLAKLAGQTKHTAIGSSLGTVAYLSPEQSESEKTDERADIWALGVILYEMLTGQLPFQGEADQVIIYSIVNEEPRAITELRSHVPEKLEYIVTKALAKDLPKRYHSVDELIVDLQHANQEPPSADTLFSTGQSIVLARMVPPSRRWLMSIFAVVALSLLGYLFFGSEAESTRRIPILVADIVNETGESELDGLSELLITSLEQSRRLSPLSRSRMYDVLRNLKKTDIERIDESLGLEICKRADIPVIAIATVRKLGQLYTIDLKLLQPESGEYLLTAREEGEGQESILAMIDKLSESIRRGLDEREDEIQLTNQTVAEVTTVNLKAYEHYFRGKNYFEQGKSDKAVAELQQALTLDTTFVLAYYQLAVIQGFGRLHRDPRKLLQAKFDERLPDKEKRLFKAFLAGADYSESGLKRGHTFLGTLEKDYPKDKEIIWTIGDFAFHLAPYSNNYTETLTYLEQVLNLQPGHVKALGHLAHAYVVTGRFDEAIACRRQLLADSYNPINFLALADMYRAAGELTNLELTNEQAVKLYPGNPYLHVARGYTYAYSGDYIRAEEYFKGMSNREKPRMFQHRGLLALARFFPYQGRFYEMQTIYDRLIEMAWSESDTTAVIAYTLDKLQRMCWGHRDHDSILAEARKVESLLNDDLPRFDLLVFGLSLIYIELGDFERSNFFKAQIRNQGPGNIAVLESEMAMAERDWDDAIAKYHLSSRINMMYPPYNNYNLALAYSGKGNLNTAISKAKNAQISCLRYHPCIYPQSFRLLGKLHEKQGDTQLAIKNYEKFLHLWKNADEDLPDLIDARERLAKLSGLSFNSSEAALPNRTLE